MVRSADRRRAELLRHVGRTGVARLTELADDLGVSIATVRRDVEALSRQGRLIRRHGTVQLDSAPGVAAAPGAAVGMMVPTNRYLELIAQAARREAERRNLRFLLERVETSADSRAAAARLVVAGCVGLIYSPQWRTDAELADPLPWLLTSPVPTVLAGREVGPEHPVFVLDSVIADHAYGIRLALDHLEELGHTRIMASLRGDSTVAQLIGRAFVTELARRGLPDLGPLLTTPTTPQIAASPRRAFAELVEQICTRRATAVIVHTDDAAVLLIHQLWAAGVGVPRDCSVIGYDNIVRPASDVALTTISPAKHQIGVEAVSLLMRRHLRAMAGLEPPPIAHVRLLPELVVRTSTAPARAVDVTAAELVVLSEFVGKRFP